MRLTVRISIADVRQHAAKKRATTDVGPSRTAKKSRVGSESVLARKTDIPSVVAPDTKSVIALSAPTVLPPIDVLLVGEEPIRDGDVTAIMSAAAEMTLILVPSARDQAESAVMAEPEPSVAISTIPPMPSIGWK